MDASNTAGEVGIFLKRKEEVELVSAAVLESGLRPRPISAAEFQASVNCPQDNDPDARDGVARLDPSHAGTFLFHPTRSPRFQWLITDQIPLRPNYRKENLLRSAQIPLTILVCDPEKKVRGRNETGRETDDENAEIALLLRRPLRLEDLRLQLPPTLRTARIFSERLRSLTGDLDRARRIFDSVCNGISVCDASLPDLPLVYVNPAFEKMTGYSGEEVRGRSCRFLQCGDTQQPGLTAIRNAIRNHCDTHALLKNYRKDGTLFWNELYLSPIFDPCGNLTHFVGFQNDVTQLVVSSERLAHLAHHDSLTGLPNRSLFMELLQQALSRATRQGTNVAVLFFDLDNFKPVNDVFGHATGDLLLKAVAARLREATRIGETVARLGGDEFVVVLENFSNDLPVTKVMQRMLNHLSQPLEIQEHRFHPSASVGAARFPADGETPEALLRAADQQMYNAKHEKRQALPPQPTAQLEARP